MPSGSRVDVTKHTAQVVKVNRERGLVVGFALISTDEGAEYTDLQKEHVPEDVMLDAALDFMQQARVSTEMHARDDAGEPVADGTVVFAFPLTRDIAKSLDITTKRTGLVIGMKPSPDVFKRFESGELTGFSIGGEGYVIEEDVA